MTDLAIPLEFKFPTKENTDSFIQELGDFNGVLGVSRFSVERVDDLSVKVKVEISLREIKEALDEKRFMLSTWVERLTFGVIKFKYNITEKLPKAATEIVGIANSYNAMSCIKNEKQRE